MIGVRSLPESVRPRLMKESPLVAITDKRVPLLETPAEPRYLVLAESMVRPVGKPICSSLAELVPVVSRIDRFMLGPERDQVHATLEMVPIPCVVGV